jgi:hypothetical protein
VLVYRAVIGWFGTVQAKLKLDTRVSHCSPPGLTFFDSYYLRTVHGIPIDAKAMPFSHHSHSGQFCGHAKGSLEEMVLQAIACEMKAFAMTEHIERDMTDLYPEEVCAFSFK